MDCKNKSNAEKTLSQNNLEGVLAEMLNSLVYEKPRNPEVYMIKYLASLLSKEDRISNGIYVPDELPVTKPIVNFPSEIKNEFLKKHLTKELWTLIKYNKTKFGANINDVLCDEALEQFRALIVNMINDIHGIKGAYRFIKKYNLIPNQIFVDSNLNFDFIQSAKFEYFRNLKDYSFTKTNATIHEEIVKKVSLVLNGLEKENELETFECIRHKDDPEQFNKIINENQIKIYSHSLGNLVLFYSHSKFVVEAENNISTIILLNDLSHVRIISSSLFNTNIHLCCVKINSIEKYLDSLLNFEFDTHFGYLNSDVNLLGNAIVFTAEVLMKKLFEYSSDSYDEINKIFNSKSIEGDTTGLVSINITQNLREDENEFISKVFQSLYNLLFIEENAKNSKIEDISNEIELKEQNAITPREKKFYNSLKYAYELSLPLHKYSHFHPDNITLNTLIKKQEIGFFNNFMYFKHFPSFFNFFLISFRGVIDEVINNKTLIHVNKNIEDFKDSLTNLENYSFAAKNLKRFNITIRRNLNLDGGNFSDLLDEIKKKEILNIVRENISLLHSEAADWDESTQTFFFRNKKIGIQLNKLDNLTFSLNVTERTEELVKLIEDFFKLFKETSNKFELNKIGYLSSANLGYYTSDLNYLGTGMNFIIEVENGEDNEFVLSDAQRKNQFYLEKNTKDKSVLLGCNLNVNTGVYKLFEVTLLLLKALNTPTKAVVIDDEIIEPEVIEAEIIKSEVKENEIKETKEIDNEIKETEVIETEVKKKDVSDTDNDIIIE